MKEKSTESSKFSFSSTFNWEDANIKEILKPIEFYIVRENDAIGTINIMSRAIQTFST